MLAVTFDDGKGALTWHQSIRGCVCCCRLVPLVSQVYTRGTKALQTTELLLLVQAYPEELRFKGLMVTVNAAICKMQSVLRGAI